MWCVCGVRVVYVLYMWCTCCVCGVRVGNNIKYFLGTHKIFPGNIGNISQEQWECFPGTVGIFLGIIVPGTVPMFLGTIVGILGILFQERSWEQFPGSVPTVPGNVPGIFPGTSGNKWE